MANKYQLNLNSDTNKYEPSGELFTAINAAGGVQGYLEQADMADFPAIMEALGAKEFAGSINQSLDRKELTLEEASQLANVFNETSGEEALAWLEERHPEFFEELVQYTSPE